jgi:hypothetical protein
LIRFSSASYSYPASAGFLLAFERPERQPFVEFKRNSERPDLADN